MNSKWVTGIGILGVALGLTLGCSDDDDGGDGGSGGGTAGTGGGTAGTGGGTAGTAGTGGSTSANGVTPCGDYPDFEPKSCQAGQYCADEKLSDCQPGCLSNTNCADNQTCEKAAGADVGTCQNISAAIGCDAFCEKVLACDPSGTQAQCEQACAMVNDACKQCIVDSNCAGIMDGACDAACDF